MKRIKNDKPFRLKITFIAVVLLALISPPFIFSEMFFSTREARTGLALLTLLLLFFGSKKLYIGGEDFEGWLRISQLSERFVRLPKPLGYFWAGGGNVSIPPRAIACLDTIEEHHAKAIKELRSHRNVYSFPYVCGKSFCQLRQFESARNHLEAVAGPEVLLAATIKSALMRLRMHKISVERGSRRIPPSVSSTTTPNQEGQ